MYEILIRYLNEMSIENQFKLYIYLKYHYALCNMVEDNPVLIRAKEFDENISTKMKNSILNYLNIVFSQSSISLQTILCDHIEYGPMDWALFSLYAQINKQHLFRLDEFILQYIEHPLIHEFNLIWNSIKGNDKIYMNFVYSQKIENSILARMTLEFEIKSYLPPFPNK